MSLEGIVTDGLNLPGVRTLRHVSSNGQHTYESVSIEPDGPPCCTVPDRSPNRLPRHINLLG